jgi:hypothetical protein
MNHLYPKQLINGLLALAMIFTTFTTASAQCPAGSTANAGGTYGNGQAVCITTNISATVTLNSGSTMYIGNGGNFTGDINASSGSNVIVFAGGIFNPNNANNFAAVVTVKKDAAATLGTGNISFSSGFKTTSNGNLTFAKSWSAGFTQTITNSSCGRMTFAQSANLQNTSTIINEGILLFQNSLTTNSGTNIDNRGAMTVTGDLSMGGNFKNQWKAVFKGSNNTFNSSTVATDSIINLYTMMFVNAIGGTAKIRNDGLFWTRGSFNYNSGGAMVMRVTNALFRVDGAISNNSTITGYGSNMYVGGAFGNNGTVKGNSGTQRLRLNQAPGNGTQTNTTVSSFTPQDTTSFAGGQGNPATCNVLLPITVTAFKGAVTENGIQLTWATLTEQNGKKFVIEYSTDAISFAVAGEVAAKGNSNARIDYSYLFTKNTGSTLYFRLNMVDIDGREEYSNIVLVKAGAVQTISAGVYPNPFTEKLQVTLSLSRSTTVALKLFDMNGRIVKSQLNNGQSGANKFTLTGLSALQPGLYLVEVTAGEEKWMQKVIR